MREHVGENTVPSAFAHTPGGRICWPRLCPQCANARRPKAHTSGALQLVYASVLTGFSDLFGGLKIHTKCADGCSQGQEGRWPKQA